MLCTGTFYTYGIATMSVNSREKMEDFKILKWAIYLLASCVRIVFFDGKEQDALFLSHCERVHLFQMAVSNSCFMFSCTLIILFFLFLLDGLRSGK